MAGEAVPGVVQISTAKLNRVIQYEPKDLTISVGAGMPFAELGRILAENGQMVPLEGAFASEATVGGMVAANISGSGRRGYGTARDWVIGMQFATLDGKLVQSGGMVVKNVAGLDMGKLMIGSFGTLAAITKVNFKLAPIPDAGTTILRSFSEGKAVFEAAGEALRGMLNPVVVDVFNPALSIQLGLASEYTLALSFAGNEAVIQRAVRESGTSGDALVLAGTDESAFWSQVRGLTPAHLAGNPEGAVGKVSTTLSQCADALGTLTVPALAHAGSGIVRGWFGSGESAAAWVADAARRDWKGVVEFAARRPKQPGALWPAALLPTQGGDFAIMRRVKQMFDPQGLLNGGRMYGLL